MPCRQMFSDMAEMLYCVNFKPFWLRFINKNPETRKM